MRTLIAMCLLFAVSAAQAERPPAYDATCLEQPAKIVQAVGGGYSYLKYPSPTECTVHGTYYRVRLHIGSIAAGQVAIFTEGEYPTLAQAEVKRQKVEKENSGFCRTSDVKVTVEPISF